MPIRHKPLFSLIAAALLLAACGGGGGGGGRTITTPPTGGGTPTPPPPTGPTYTPGVFAPASDFKDRCQNPRVGVDIEGNPFPDLAGSTVEENFWLRSWTHETYLWNDEVAEADPYDYNDPIAYFATQKTNEVTPSGAPKDDFHFTQSTEDYLTSINSVPSASYGVNFAAYRTTPPRDFRILFTDPGTPAREQAGGRDKFLRGSRILEIDGVDFVNGGATQAQLDILNNGLFPPTAGETHSFTMEDVDGTVRSFSIVSADLSTSAVNTVEVLDTMTGKVGYILFNTFSPFASEQQLFDAITQLDQENVTDLVIDLRYNGGGLLAIASQMSYMVAGPVPTTGKTFELLQFNDDAGNFNPVTGEVNDPIPFYNTGVGFTVSPLIPLPDLDLDRVYILSTESTCSASEAVINGLRGVGIEVVLIGTTTCGKPYGFYPTDNCGTTYYSIQFQGVNDLGFGDYADGFTPNNSGEPFAEQAPGCEVLDDLTRPLGDPAEDMLAAALQYRQSGTCPAAPVSVTSAIQSSSPVPTTEQPTGLEITIPVDPSRTNRDMRLPEGQL